jgi:hypothetical protein
MLTLRCGAEIFLVNQEIRIHRIRNGGVYVKLLGSSIDPDFPYFVGDACVILTSKEDCDKLISVLQELKEQLRW